jgi:pSer/pThr/pTyr-binding forkhead associated (FHA) protein
MTAGVQCRVQVTLRLMWILQSAEPAGDPVTFRVFPGSNKTVGRAARADFILDAALVSRLHCRLEAGDEVLEVVDLSSTNGTYVNDKRIERARLSTGDRLRVGRVELKVARQA